MLTPIQVTTPAVHIRLRDRLRMRPRLLGLLVALVFFWESLNPTLLPRAWAVQALLCGACSAIGYAIGASCSVVLGWVRGRMGLGALDTRLGRRLVWSAWAVAVLVGAVVWANWQNDQRTLVDMPLIQRSDYIPVLIVGAILLLAFVTIGRLVGQGSVAAHRGVAAVFPRSLAFVTTILLTVGFLSFVAQDFVFDRLVAMANAAYSTVDDETEPGIRRPTTTLASGGPGSLVPWDTLGFQGRTFTGGVTTPEQLETLVAPGTPVRQPIRVYAGLQSADSPEARARLAVRELERTGAFERRVLVVATTTGTGWINPRSARSLEALNGGDTAIVGIQYSYLPSWISFLVDLDKASEAGRALYDAVRERWLREPAGSRPELMVFGESLGSFGSEHAFDASAPDRSVENIVDGTDGALWVGPTWSNPIRTPLVLDRGAGSPTWRPRIGDGRTVVFTNGRRSLLGVDGQSVVYQQHASDPVGWWNWSSAYERPAWLQGPRGYDVPARAHWFPIVTWGQTSADLIAGFSTPPGHGHNYDGAWPEAWAAVAAPDGWTRADTVALSKRIAAFPPQPGG
ncbi:MAG: hypothetical protein RL531_1637 [Actinomycetota bacterium]|jgi:uncharacterized membrane protein